MVTAQTLLTDIFYAGTIVTGILALRLLIVFRQLSTAAMPPFPYNDATLHDFELLSAAGGILLFTSFTAIMAGFYEITALQVAIRVPAILFTVLLATTLYRWRRRF